MDAFDRIKTQNDALWTLLTSTDEEERRAAFEVAFDQKPQNEQEQSNG